MEIKEYLSHDEWESLQFKVDESVLVNCGPLVECKCGNKMEL